MKPIWIIVISVILTGAVIGGGVYYYQNKKLTDAKKDLNNQITALQTQVNNLKTSSSTTTTTPSASTATPITSTSTADNWKNESDKVVDSYLSYFSLSGPNIAGVTKPATCGTGVSTTACTSLKALKTIQFSNYLICLVNSPQANDMNSGLLINFDPVLGMQDEPGSYTINSSTLSGDQVIVKATLNFDNPKNVDFYLQKENGKWLISATSVTNIFDASKYGCTKN